LNIILFKMAIIESITVKDVKLELGELIRQVRKEHRLNQDELADALNISRITISNLELGKNTTLDTLLKVFLYFDILDNFHEYIKELARNNSLESLY
jgi:transcriptional regulator with XRE-family HTH domain